MTLLKRYQNGEYQSVWKEIRRVSNEQARKNQAMCDVAEATMENVRHNADLITERLRSWGWRALGSEYSDLRTFPSVNDPEIIGRIEFITGAPMPLSFLKFWEIVGSINWVWDYKTGEDCPNLGIETPLDEMDPLCVEPPCAALWQLDQWDSGEYELLTEGTWQLELAPDYLHKANISGGDPYSIALPSTDPDPIFEWYIQNMSFVDYLRFAFKWVGFPLLAKHRRQTDVEEFVAEFRRGLVEF